MTILTLDDYIKNKNILDVHVDKDAGYTINETSSGSFSLMRQDAKPIIICFNDNTARIIPGLKGNNPMNNTSKLMMITRAVK